MRSLPRRVLVTTVPFGTIDPTPLQLLKAAKIECVINPLGRKLKASEVGDMIRDFPVIIAGTEIISAEAMESAAGLKAICRVGIGLDGIDLMAARRLGVSLSYTPNGPSAAVSELTIGHMISLLRGVAEADRGLRAGQWQRVTGRRLGCSVVGVVGVGRIGKRVIRHLQGGFPGVRILANDIKPDAEALAIPGVEWVEKEMIWRDCDVITLHVPLTAQTYGLVGAKEFAAMRPEAVLINTARGGIANEVALADALRSGQIARAAIDVFVEEPYVGELIEFDRALLTCHMGSMTVDCRVRMEVEATEEAIRFLDGVALANPVPEDEYIIDAGAKAHGLA